MFAVGELGALDQAAVRAEVADRGKARDVVDLVEHDQGEDLADTGYGAQAVEVVRVVDLGGASDGELDVGE